MQTAAAPSRKPRPQAAPDGAQAPQPKSQVWRETDHIIVTSSVTWAGYMAMRALCDSPGIRMAYDQGVLEIMSPSYEHENAKTLIGRLIEAYAVERDIELIGCGSTTLRKEIKERGLEPDECYNVGHPFEQAPDFAIEVVITGGGIDKLPIYASIGVQEVWFWCEGKFDLFTLVGDSYEATTATKFLPELDLDFVAELVRTGDQHKSVRALLARLRG